MVLPLEQVLPVELVKFRRSRWVSVGRASEVVVAPVVPLVRVVSRQIRLARALSFAKAVPARGAQRRPDQVVARGDSACPRPSRRSDGAGGGEQREWCLAVVLRKEVVAPAAQLGRLS